jgi:integrase
LSLNYLGKVMNWHASRDDDFRSPIVRGMAKQKSKARNRILTDDEIRLVWSGPQNVFGRYIRFLLLTAVRRNEAARMTRAELAGDVWTIPASRMKGGVEYVVPLSRAALSMLPTAGEFMFSTDGRKPIGSFSKFKRTFDQVVPLTKPWTLHDLRRTARSLMSRAGVDRDHAERCLAHKIGGIRGVYDWHEFFSEKKAAFEKLAALVGEIVGLQ